MYLDGKLSTGFMEFLMPFIDQEIIYFERQQEFEKHLIEQQQQKLLKAKHKRYKLKRKIHAG